MFNFSKETLAAHKLLQDLLSQYHGDWTLYQPRLKRTLHEAIVVVRQRCKEMEQQDIDHYEGERV